MPYLVKIILVKNWNFLKYVLFSLINNGMEEFMHYGYWKLRWRPYLDYKNTTKWEVFLRDGEHAKNSNPIFSLCFSILWSNAFV